MPLSSRTTAFPYKTKLTTKKNSFEPLSREYIHYIYLSRAKIRTYFEWCKFFRRKFSKNAIFLWI